MALAILIFSEGFGNDLDNFVTMGRLDNGLQLQIALQQTQLINNKEFQSCNLVFSQETIFAQLGCCPKNGDTNFVTASADLANVNGKQQ